MRQRIMTRQIQKIKDVVFRKRVRNFIYLCFLISMLQTLVILVGDPKSSILCTLPTIALIFSHFMLLAWFCVFLRTTMRFCMNLFYDVWCKDCGYCLMGFYFTLVFVNLTVLAFMNISSKASYDLRVPDM
jgi:hypothetical protein